MSSVAKVCVVTGGSSGVGAAIGERFVAAGYHVVSCSRRAPAAETSSSGGLRRITRPVDVADAQALTSFLHSTVAELGRIDVLVNNAGDAPRMPVAALPLAEFEQAIAVHVRAVFLATQLVWPAMVRQGDGTVLSISSLASISPLPGFSVYGGCKAWINTFTKAIAAEGQPHNIRAFALALGAVDTPLLRRVAPEFDPAKALQPAAVAEVVLRLCDEALRPLSGETLPLQA
jgi:NAD(P)-dependent dehydrogenase (short-subunit alcohol dehydrogenase family)